MKEIKLIGQIFTDNCYLEDQINNYWSHKAGAVTQYCDWHQTRFLPLYLFQGTNMPRWYGNITHLFTFWILSSIIVKVWFQLLFFHTIIQFCCRKWHELWDAITTGLKQFRKSISKMFKLIASCLHEFYKYWSLNPQVKFITILYGTKSHSLYP